MLIKVEELSNKCPVCNGTGKAFENKTGGFTGEECSACKGNGSALWKKNKSQPRVHKVPSKEIRGVMPYRVSVSQFTDDYGDYVNKCLELNIAPEDIKKIHASRRYWREKGMYGLYWQAAWSDDERTVLFSSRTYLHYVAMVKRFNDTNNKQLTIRTAKTIGTYITRFRSEMLYPWSNQSASYLLESIGGTKPDIVFSIFSKMCLGVGHGMSSVFRITGIRQYANMGTTEDLALYLKTQTLQAKGIKRKLYIKWLDERRGK